MSTNEPLESKPEYMAKTQCSLTGTADDNDNRDDFTPHSRSSWAFIPGGGEDGDGAGDEGGYGAYNEALQTAAERSEAEEQAAKAKRNKRTWDGVFLPVSVSVFGVVLFIRLPWIVGEAGLFLSLLAIFLCYLASGLTTVSMAAISTNGYVGDGGPYMMISRCLGPQVGIVVGVTFVLANAVSSAMYLIGSAEIMARIIPWGDLDKWRQEDKYLVTLIISSVMLMILLIIAFLSIEKPFRICCLLLTVISIVDIIVAMTSERPNEEYGFTGPTRDSWSDNLKPNFSPSTDFATILSVLFPGVTGVMSGVCVSGELVHTAKAIPKGIAYAWVTSLIIYTSITFVIASSFRRAFLQNNFGILNHVGHPWFFYPGEAVACFAAVLAMLGGSIRVLQAMAKDNLIQVSILQYIESTSLKNATLFYGFIVQLILFAGDTYQPVSLIAAQIYCCNFAALNLSTFVSSVSGVVSFRPIYRFFNKTTALLGALVNIVLMFYMSPVAALCFVTFFIALVVIIDFNVDTRNLPWGDASQPIVFHFVRKWLLRLDERKEHIRHWRPSIVMVSTDPLCSLNLIHLANNLKKGGLFEIAYILKGDFETTSVACFKWKGWAMDFIGASAIKAFAVVTFGETLRAGVQSILRTCGIGGMKANTVIVSLDELLQRDAFIEIYKNYTDFKEEEEMLLGGGGGGAGSALGGGAEYSQYGFGRRKNAVATDGQHAANQAQAVVGNNNGGGGGGGGGGDNTKDVNTNDYWIAAGVASYFQFGQRGRRNKALRLGGGAKKHAGRSSFARGDDELTTRQLKRNGHNNHNNASDTESLSSASNISTGSSSHNDAGVRRGLLSSFPSRNKKKNSRNENKMDAVRSGANCAGNGYDDDDDHYDPNENYAVLVESGAGGRNEHSNLLSGGAAGGNNSRISNSNNTRASNRLGDIIERQRAMAPVVNEQIRAALTRTSVVLPRGAVESIGQIHRRGGGPNMMANDWLDYSRLSQAAAAGGGDGNEEANSGGGGNKQHGGGGTIGGFFSKLFGRGGGAGFGSGDDGNQRESSNYDVGRESAYSFGGIGRAASATTQSRFGLGGGGGAGSSHHSQYRSKKNAARRRGGGGGAGGESLSPLAIFSNNASKSHRDDEEHQIERMVAHRKIAIEHNERLEALKKKIVMKQKQLQQRQQQQREHERQQASLLSPQRQSSSASPTTPSSPNNDDININNATGSSKRPPSSSSIPSLASIPAPAVDLAPYESIEEFCNICADVNHVHMNLVIARNIDKLDKKAIEQSPEKVFIDLWLPDEEDAVVFLMGYSLSRTSVWQKNAVLRIVSVVTFNHEIEAQNAAMRSILKAHRIDALVHTVSLEMETYRRRRAGEPIGGGAGYSSSSPFSAAAAILASNVLLDDDSSASSVNGGSGGPQQASTAAAATGGAAARGTAAAASAAAAEEMKALLANDATRFELLNSIMRFETMLNTAIILCRVDPYQRTTTTTAAATATATQQQQQQQPQSRGEPQEDEEEDVAPIVVTTRSNNLLDVSGGGGGATTETKPLLCTVANNDHASGVGGLTRRLSSSAMNALKNAGGAAPPQAHQTTSPIIVNDSSASASQQQASQQQQKAKEWFASIVALSTDLPPMLMISGGSLKGRTADW